MIEPRFDLLHSMEERKQKHGEPGGVFFHRGQPHRNPKLYKYHWWVFWRGSPIEGEEFLTAQHSMRTAAAMNLVSKLQERGEMVWLYLEEFPRDDPVNAPWDPTVRRWKGRVFAPAYDDDTDPLALVGCVGHK